MVKRALIVTPTSLVSNWESEINKWVGGRLKIIALCESTRADVVSGIDSFLRPLSPFQVNIYDINNYLSPAYSGSYHDSLTQEKNSHYGGLEHFFL